MSREELERRFEQDYPEGFSSLSQEIDALKRYHLYCGTCQHDFGCEHGVPVATIQKGLINDQ